MAVGGNFTTATDEGGYDISPEVTIFDQLREAVRDLMQENQSLRAELAVRHEAANKEAVHQNEQMLQLLNQVRQSLGHDSVAPIPGARMRYPKG